MTKSNQGTPGHTPLVTEIKETEAFGYHISLSNDSLYVSPKKPIDDGDEVVAAFCETWKADRDRIQSLEGALKWALPFAENCIATNERCKEFHEDIAMRNKARAALDGGAK